MSNLANGTEILPNKGRRALPAVLLWFGLFTILPFVRLHQT